MQKLIISDWKDTEGFFEELQSVLREMGVHMYSDPRSEGSDDIAYIVSDAELSEDEIDEVSKAWWGDFDDEEDEEDEEIGDEEENEDDFFDLDDMEESVGGPLGPGESDFKKAEEFNNAAGDVCPTCGTPYEEWELIDGLWTCPTC